MNVHDPHAFQIFIYRVLKEVKPEHGISKNAMNILNDIMADLTVKILQEGRNLTIYGKKSTLSSREIETAVKLLY